MDRKALIRNYKESRRPMGAFRVHNRVNGKSLVGACTEFEILDTLTPPDEPDYDPTDDLRVLEQLWFEKLSPFDDRGYNVRPKRPGP